MDKKPKKQPDLSPTLEDYIPSSKDEKLMQVHIDGSLIKAFEACLKKNKHKKKEVLSGLMKLYCDQYKA